MKRSKFNLSHYKLLTANPGYLVPLTWYEALPGDTIQHQTGLMLRLSPLVAPIMHPMRVRLHHWFVPNRLIWEDWEDFITGGDDGLDASVHPFISTDDLTSDTVDESGLLDYLGIMPADYTGNTRTFSALPYRAYMAIYNEYYRDQDLKTAVSYDVTSGQETSPSQSCMLCAWEKDYLTTSRAWTQKGTEVTIPVSPETVGSTLPTFTYGSATENLEILAAQDNVSVKNTTPGTTRDLAWGDPGLMVNIDELRLALALGRYQEARAQYGSRYVEYLRYLGVRSSDARLQKPEYLGGGRMSIQTSEVLRTGNVDADSTNIGDMAGHGIGAGSSKRFRRFFEEHGIVMTMMSVIPKTIYNNALHRSFLREDKEDYFQKELQFIGDQEVSNAEVMIDHTGHTATFGYQQRYDEYRTLPSSIAGEFRDTMDHWHMARIFSSDASLNSSFIDCYPTTRVYASTSTDKLLCLANHSVQARRMLTRYPQKRTI
ncbi:MAG: major capsid protein [Microviridae sp.]|nr:MAG: major capsid protein [Microviridae sp.]